MGDCTALERVFSNAIPQLFGTIFMFIITAIGLLVFDWRMGLCIVVSERSTHTLGQGISQMLKADLPFDSCGLPLGQLVQVWTVL